MTLLAKLRIDGFLLGLFAAMAIGLILPARGGAADVLEWVTKVAIAVLFLLYGTRLEPREALAGLRHWRLHTTVLTATYVLFPLLGLAMRLLVPSVLSDELYTGMLYLCLLPSTVQSSIAFTAIARGNVAAAVVSASVSNLLGVFLTPLLVMLLMQTTGDATVSPMAIVQIVVQLLLPFIAGQLLRPKLHRVLAHTTLTKIVDRGSVYLVVYAAFSAGMVEHVWQGLAVGRLLAVVGVAIVLLAVVLGVTAGAARLLGFDRADRIVVIFCGSKKSLATGLPMATVLFAGHPVGLIVLPLMIFHQIQLITCAALAGRWGRAADEAEAARTAVTSPDAAVPDITPAPPR
ncbi:bile acid:sodium symporter family protein [Nocardia cerradoensis]|uniref:bile acid:sodium symporter family protein n=1 Tax=Nocardia cerradoensis TaxID=85688 RepID=UPI00068648B0|nr:bile acid:sodium symporter family protein [Nocardia cerradoensis]NKY42433.1 bile acid:sodium symporter [Nocardia cerradoensis]